MMEKYGVTNSTYEVVIPIVGKTNDFVKIASELSLSEASDMQKMNPGAIVRPE